MGVVFQNPDSQLVATVVEEDVAFGPENLGLPSEEIRARVEWALDAVGIRELRMASPQRLSGGQKQRVAIAGALALSPRYLILDEPTSMLDPEGRREFIEVIETLKVQGGLGILFITHRLEELKMADSICLLEQGCIGRVLSWGDLPEAEGLMKKSGVALPVSVQVGLNLRRRGLAIADPTDFEGVGQVVGGLKVRFEPERRPEGMASPIFRICDVSHTYAGQTPWKHRSLRKVSLDIGKGTGVGFVGATGSGKSTLAQHLNALISAQSGRISVGGIDISAKGRDLKSLRRQIGFVFQNPEYQFFEETVEAEISFAPRNFGMSPEQVKRAVVESLTWVGLNPEEFRSRSPHALSGGEKRLVAIASVLAFQPEVLVLDEPTAGLDASHRMSILSLLREWRQRTGGTLIVVSHELEDLAFLVERCLVLEAGEVKAFEDFRALLPRLPELGIPLPWLPETLLKAHLKGDFPVTAEEFEECEIDP